MFHPLQSILCSALRAAFPDISVEPTVEIPQMAGHGDFASTVAMRVAKMLGKPPRIVAEMIAAALPQNEIIERTEIAGAGFLNFFVTDRAIFSALPSCNYPKKNENPRRIIVEYGQENIAKPMSVGHLRSNIIGKSLVEIFRFLGETVITENHLGDWGTQFGKLIVAFKKWGDRATIEQNPIAELNRLYVRFHDEIEAHPELEDEARAEFFTLENGDRENHDLWLWMRKESLLEFSKMYARLGSEFEHLHGEAFFSDRLAGVIDELLKKGIAQRNPDGSIIASFPEEFSPSPLLIQKSDGATLYATRDLAAVKFYVEEFSPDLVLQSAGSEQALHFRQFYDVAARAGWIRSGQFVHIQNGLVSLPEGKMSTRKGRVVRLEDLLDEAEKRIAAILDEKKSEISGSDRQKLIADLAVGAVKFADLGQTREANIVFSWEKALSFDGYAGPYLQYAHARAQAILRKNGASIDAEFSHFSLPVERSLSLLLLQFLPAVQTAAATFHSHGIAQYLFRLAQSFNGFYHEAPVLTASENEKLLRLFLVKKTAETLATGLRLLGIAAPDRM